MLKTNYSCFRYVSNSWIICSQPSISKFLASIHIICELRANQKVTKVNWKLRRQHLLDSINNHFLFCFDFRMEIHEKVLATQFQAPTQGLGTPVSGASIWTQKENLRLTVRIKIMDFKADDLCIPVANPWYMVTGHDRYNSSAVP